jgi:phosphoglycerate dehydrogenase-like enzyme
VKPTPDNHLVVVTGRHGDDEQQRIQVAATGHDVEFVESVSARPDLLARASAVAGSLSDDDLAQAPNLCWVHSWAAGVDSHLTPAMANSTVVLTSATGNGAVPLAEHAMLLMLMLNRDAPRWIRAQAEHRWDRFVHGELAGLTCGIIGLGQSGADLAQKAKAFHMQVVGTRRHAGVPVPGVDRIYPPHQLHDLLSTADFVVVTAPRTPATTGLFGAAEFGAMKESAFFICYSRGGIADDAALLTALTSGQIAGAGLDAHGIEPLPEDSPFWDLPNVIITPHNGATTAATRRRGVEIFIGNLERFVAGRPLVNVVDKAAGY